MMPDKPAPLHGDFGILEWLGQQWDEAQRRIVESDARLTREDGQAVTDPSLENNSEAES